MMRRRIYYITAATTTALCILLAGCGMALRGGADNAEGEMAKEVFAESILAEAPDMPISELKQEIALLYHTGSLTQEEESAALDMLTTMYHNLELPEYYGEGIHMAGNEAWQDILAKNLLEGCRSYYLQKDGKTLLSVQIGYGVSGGIFTNIFLPGEDSIVLLKHEGSMVQLTWAQVQDNACDGSYERWQLDGAGGGIRQEKGTYSAGVPTGEHIVAVREGDGAGDPFDLWNMRENFAYETTVTVYDEMGNVVEPIAEPESEAVSETQKAEVNPAPTQKPAVKPAAKPASKPAAQTTSKPAEKPSAQTPAAAAPSAPAPAPSAPVSSAPSTAAPSAPTPAPVAPSTPAPEVPASPAPAPTPAPVAPSSPAPAPTPAPEVPASPAPAPDAGDVDIEWSDDIM